MDWLHLLQVFPLAEKWALGDSFHGQLHSLFRNSSYFHLNLSSFNFWSQWPELSHGQLTCASYWFAQVQISCDLDTDRTNLALQEASPSQAPDSATATGAHLISPHLWEVLLSHCLRQQQADQLFVFFNYSWSSSFSLSVLFLSSGLTWYSSVLYICRATLALLAICPVVCSGISWSLGFLSKSCSTSKFPIL